MVLSSTPVANRVHIAFFGNTNAGKSSLVNALTSQKISLVSDLKGTTTDPVKKTMELLPLGPVVIIDTAGFDDDTEIGKLRVQKTKEILSKTDIAVLVVDSLIGLNEFNYSLIKLFQKKNIPYVVVFNKADLLKNIPNENQNEVYVSAKNCLNIDKLKEKIVQFAPKNIQKPIISDLLAPDDIAVLVIPIDQSAPKGRLILPQQQTLRDILDNHKIAICTQVNELQIVIENLFKKPKVVVVDSQVFGDVEKIIPKDIYLTSFSILFARYKGELEILISGVDKIKHLKENDTILISEACTHHRQCNDIGSVKIPKLLEKITGKNFNYKFSSGGDFDFDFDKISLVIHCGGCMLNEKEMKTRLELLSEKKVSVVNYGVLLAYLNGILDRSLEIFDSKK